MGKALPIFFSLLLGLLVLNPLFSTESTTSIAEASPPSKLTVNGLVVFGSAQPGEETEGRVCDLDCDGFIKAEDASPRDSTILLLEAEQSDPEGNLGSDEGIGPSNQDSEANGCWFECWFDKTFKLGGERLSDATRPGGGDPTTMAFLGLLLTFVPTVVHLGLTRRLLKIYDGNDKASRNLMRRVGRDWRNYTPYSWSSDYRPRNTILWDAHLPLLGLVMLVSRELLLVYLIGFIMYVSLHPLYFSIPEHRAARQFLRREKRTLSNAGRTATSSVYDAKEEVRNYYRSQTIAELKKLLIASGLPVAGRKEDLVERLFAIQFPQDNPRTKSAKPSTAKKQRMAPQSSLPSSSTTTKTKRPFHCAHPGCNYKGRTANDWLTHAKSKNHVNSGFTEAGQGRVKHLPHHQKAATLQQPVQSGLSTSPAPSISSQASAAQNTANASPSPLPSISSQASPATQRNSGSVVSPQGNDTMVYAPPQTASMSAKASSSSKHQFIEIHTTQLSKLSRHVSENIMRKEALSDLGKTTLANEVKILRKLQKAGLPYQVLGKSNQGLKNPLLEMPVLGTDNLLDVVTRLTNADRKTLITNLASAITQLHSAGVVHRDLKLANIMITEDKHGRISFTSLIDFGLAMNQGAQQASHVLGGTRPFMHPSQETDGIKAHFGQDWFAFSRIMIVLSGGCSPEALDAKLRLDQHVSIAHELQLLGFTPKQCEDLDGFIIASTTRSSTSAEALDLVGQRGVSAASALIG